VKLVVGCTRRSLHYRPIYRYFHAGASTQVWRWVRIVADILVLIPVMTNRWQQNPCLPPYISEFLIYICMVCADSAALATIITVRTYCKRF